MNSVPLFDIKAVPKAELQVHVEGTLEPGMLLDFARRNDVAIPYRSMTDVLSAYRFYDLRSFLEIYWAGLSVLRTERDFYELTRAYLTRAREDNVVHAEIYVTPATIPSAACRSMLSWTASARLMQTRDAISPEA